MKMKFLIGITLSFITILSYAQPKMDTAIFAMGCFWCAQHDFEQVHGVTKVIAGYTGGNSQNPTYEQVSKGGAGHFEAIKVIYDPKQVSYKELLNFFWHNVDPTDANGQFCDKGDQYRAAIFYQSDQEKQIAESSKTQIKHDKKYNQIATLILPALPFYPAETYHQDYYRKNPLRYKFYRYNCGRDQRLHKLWSKI